jgi:hypothetical protein
MRLAFLLLAMLALLPAAQAGSIVGLDPADPTIFTDVNFAIVQPPATTVAGFALTYSNALTTITGLTLTSGAATLTTNGTNEVDATFPAPISSGDFQWVFNTPISLPIAALNIDFAGQSKVIVGGSVNITVEPLIPEPDSFVMLALGLCGIGGVMLFRAGVRARR